MLVYDGSNGSRYETRTHRIPSERGAGAAPRLTRKRLVCNRACALIVLIVVNAATYYAIKTLVTLG